MKHSFNRFLFILTTITLIHLIVLFVRDLLVQNKIYDFLLWNLFLGVIPLIIALLLHGIRDRINKVLFWAVCFVWLLFYPNAPYMISDLIHVRQDTTTYLIYDTLIIFSFAMLSVYYGLFSLSLMWRGFQQELGKKWAWLIISGCLLLSSVGFYLGRVIRLNSWDLFTQPLKVFSDIWTMLSPESGNGAIYVMILLFTGVQLMLWVMTKNVYDFEQKD